jgi:hypothetical protein
VENKGIEITTQVRWLGNPGTIRERMQNGEITSALVVFFIKSSKVAHGVVRKVVLSLGVWYRVETYTNDGPDSRCELCCGWGNIENKCSSKPKCGYCSAHRRTSNHKCNVVGCAAKLELLCVHRLEMYSNCKQNHIAFSSRCVKKREATKAVRQSRKIGVVGCASTSAARDMVMGLTRVVLGPWVLGVAEGGRDEEEMADVDEEEEAAGLNRDITMGETETETAMRSATDTETETETGALATND